MVRVPDTVAESETPAEREARFDQHREALTSFLGLTSEEARTIRMFDDPVPEVVQHPEGVTVITDGDMGFGVDADGWREIEDSTFIVAVQERLERFSEGIRPQQKCKERLLSIAMAPDCPPYRVVQALIKAGIEL